MRVILAVVLLLAGCASESDDPRGIRATFDLAISPADFPESESQWPEGEPITVECWGEESRTWVSALSAITLVIYAGTRYAFTTSLSPVVLRAGGASIRQVDNVFPGPELQSEPELPPATTPLELIQRHNEESRRRLRAMNRARNRPHLSELYKAVEGAAKAACR